MANFKPKQGRKTQEQKQHFLKPIDQIMNRLKWDERFSKDYQSFVIGYMDRFTGMQETTIGEMEEQALIPTHRIYYLKATDNSVVWDRAQRIDLISK